ncbi:MAG: L,D-transpeptidase [Verrucomicrobia bacterium]|nr:L,D-transpeptidase [Verrucomicrobiota bacterium]
MQIPQPRIEVSIGTQTLALWDGSRLVKQWPCSTSKFGIGFREGSNQTPLGAFRVAEKFGDGLNQRTVFKARVPAGEWDPAQAVEGDLIVSRILWLEGAESRNANTRERYIYIHGTNEEGRVGQVGSHGCVRMRNADVAELFAATPPGTPVWIEE